MTNNLVDHRNQTETANAISELAAATAADYANMVSLTATVQTLTTQLASTNAQLVAALAANATRLGNGAGHRGRERTPNPYAKGKHYCWTCGFDCDHSSTNCPSKAAGHIDHVHRHNTKNGSQANKK